MLGISLKVGKLGFKRMTGFLFWCRDTGKDKGRLHGIDPFNEDRRSQWIENRGVKLPLMDKVLKTANSDSISAT